MPANYGQQVKLAIAVQSALATFPAAAIMRPIRFYDDPVQVKADWQPDPVIGGSVQNDFDTPSLQQDMPMVEGTRTFPLCANQSGDIFALLFGIPATTGAGPFVHTFVSGNPLAPRISGAERRLSATRQRRLIGEVMNSFGIQISKENGTQRYTIGVMARNEEKSVTPLTLVLTERAFAPLAKRTAQININGSPAADAMVCKFDYSTGAKDIPYLDGTGFVSAIEREDDATLSGSLTVRTNTDTFHDLGDAGNLITIGTVIGSGNAMFQLTANVRLGRFGQPVSGRGGLTTEIPFTGQVTAASPMLTVALTNSLAALSYV